MPYLIDSRIKSLFFGLVVLTGLSVASQSAFAQNNGNNPNNANNRNNQPYLTGEPKCLSKVHDSQHPILCDALANLYRVRELLRKGDDKKHNNTNDSIRESREDAISLKKRNDAITKINAAILDVRAAILSDPK